MDNTDYLYGSNGSGEAPRLTVIQARAAGATTLWVDAVTNVPAKFIATSGTLNQTTGLLDPTTIKVFRGRVVSGKLEIDAFAPGYTDVGITGGHTVGQSVIIKPATLWADFVAAAFADVKDSLGGSTPVKLVVSAVQPAADPDKTVIWFEPL